MLRETGHFGIDVVGLNVFESQGADDELFQFLFDGELIGQGKTSGRGFKSGMARKFNQ